MASSLLCAGSARAQSATAADWEGARPSIRVELEPGADDGRWFAAATVTDLRNGKLLATPSLELTAGAPAAIELGTEGATRMRLQIEVDSTGTRAVWSFELSDADGPLTSQHAVLTLQRPGNAAY